MNSEIWRPIPSLPTYEASSHGRLKRIPYKARMPSGGERVYGGTPTRGSWCANTKRYILSYKGRNYKAHRLICEAFHGPAPFPRAVVMHIDENSSNNTPENLKWGTQRENLNAPGFIAYCRARTGRNNPYIKGRARQA